MRPFVAFDLESVVRSIVKDPYKEQHMFQIGGVRFGPDSAWVSQAEEFGAFTQLRRPEDEALIYSDDLRACYDAEKRPRVAHSRFGDACSPSTHSMGHYGVQSVNPRVLLNERG